MPIVAGVFSAVNVGSIQDPDLAAILQKALEDADVAAIHQCLADGYTVFDADVIIAAKAAARQQATQEFLATYQASAFLDPHEAGSKVRRPRSRTRR